MIYKKLISGMLLCLSVFWLVFSFVSLSSNSYYDVKYSNNAYFDNNEIEIKLKTSKSWNLTGTSIYIDDNDPTCNWSKTANENEWCTGSGTWKDPYIIENVTIDMRNNTDSCLTIANSSVPYIIRKCCFYNSRSYENLEDIYLNLGGGGIMLYNVGNGTITHNNCTSNKIGIYAFGMNISIYENNMVNNEYGICFYGADNTIYLNNIIGSEYCGICSANSYYNLIMKNSINFNNRAGIFLKGTTYTYIYENECNNNKEYGIWIDNSWVFCDPRTNITYISIGGYGNWISENTVNNNSYGIILNYTMWDEITNNTVNNNNYSGIAIYESEDINIENNNINENYYGIKLSESEDNRVFFNNINRNYYGVDSYETKYDSISKNSFNENYYGITLNETRLTNIKQNTINNSFYGVVITSSRIVTISYNTIYYYKICIKEQGDCDDNIIEDNDCIKLKENSPDWTLLIIITVSASLAVAIIIFIFLVYRRRISR
ncbi:MAG: NosD domain-containing protein [Promethearchaeota archaeon]